MEFIKNCILFKHTHCLCVDVHFDVAHISIWNTSRHTHIFLKLIPWHLRLTPAFSFSATPRGFQTTVQVSSTHRTNIAHVHSNVERGQLSRFLVHKLTNLSNNFTRCWQQSNKINCTFGNCFRERWWKYSSIEGHLCVMKKGVYYKQTKSGASKGHQLKHPMVSTVWTYL